MKKQLHPGVKWIFRLNGFFSGIVLLFILFGFSAAALSNNSVNMNFILMLGLSYVIVFLIIAEIYAQMAYGRWFYDFTDNQLRSERGIIWKKYSNIPYERVQNVDITRGIIARVCGFSTVNIQTAGFSYAGGKAGQSEGYIPGVPVEEAEKIREFLMKKISKRSKQGL